VKVLCLGRQGNMKKSMTSVVALLAGAYSVHCQGFVSFADAYTLAPYIYVSLGTIKLGGSATNTGVPTNDTGDGNDWTVALWGGPLGDSSAQLEANGNLATATLANGVSDSIPGTWLSRAVATIPGVSTKSSIYASVQLAAWYNDGGTITSYTAAQAAGVPVGLSAIATADYSTEGPEGPPQTAPSLPSGTGPGELGNIILSFPPGVSQSGAVLTVTVNADQSGTVGPNSIILTWPATTNGGFSLQSTTNVCSPMVWANVSNSPVVVNGQNIVTNLISGGQQFFRLANP
jgi:hypothetical protein